MIQYWMIRLVEFLTLSLMICSSLYSLTNNKIYASIISFVQTVAPTYTLAQILTLTPLLLVGLLSLCFYILGDEKHMERIHTLSWMLHSPSVLWFSQIDWLKIIGFPIDFQVFQTSLSFAETLIISIILVSGRIMLFYTSHVRRRLSEFLKRGASEEDLKNAVLNMMMFAFACLGLSILNAVALSSAIPALKENLSPIIAKLPYPYMIIGITCLLAIPACVILYVHSQTQSNVIKKRRRPMKTRLTEFAIYKVIKEQGGSISKEELIEKFGGSEEIKREIEDKLVRMKIYGIITIEEGKIKINV